MPESGDATTFAGGSPTAASPREPSVPTARLVPGETFASRYRIIRLLGVGGMGAVYQAWDDELGVPVAIKTILPDTGADPTTAHDVERRFKRELVLARQVTHPNVVRIHDLGEVNGLRYITMPFINGQALSDVLFTEGRLPVSRALGIFRQLVAGMEAAHAKGIVHRDLKPANVMIEDGHVFIMDFGIARSIASNTMLTMAGSLVGTFDYMAPEQATGQPIDQRADIYALGLLLQDMLAGRGSRAKTDNPLRDLMQRIQSPPTPVRSLAPDVPEGVEAILLRCLQVDPAARFESTAALGAALTELDESGLRKPATGSTVSMPPPTRSSQKAWLMPAVVTVALLAVAAAWVATRGPAAPETPVVRAPVSVLIADFEDPVGDSTFDGTLEPVLKLALEGADFINAYDRVGVTRGLGVRPPEVLDERAALELAVKNGVEVVLSGRIEPRGAGYAVWVKATRAVTGDVIVEATETASDRNQVLGVTTRLADAVREALGDDTSDAAQRFAMDTLSATSIEVVRDYAAAMDSLSRSRFDDARQAFGRAVERDPSFGLAYAGLAIASRNLDNQQDAERYVNEAIRHLDGMTERERYRTRGLFYFITSDYQACVREYGDLIERFSADAAARNNLALCLTYLRDLPRAVEEMRQVVRILPNRALYRENLALYANYSGDFDTAAQEVQKMADPGLFGRLALAFAQVGQGQRQAASATYQSLASIDELGRSYAASGLGDLATYEGRFADAILIYSNGADADLRSNDNDRAASKLVALGGIHAWLGQAREAAAAAERALAASQTVKTRFLAARVLVDAGAADRARSLGEGLASELQAAPQAYGRIVQGMLAMKAGDARQAITLLTDANRLLDTWIGHFELGRAYLDAGAFAQADSEFDRCLTRRGEALSLFLDEEPTFGVFPPIYYYQGRARDGLNSANVAESYRAYLDIRGASTTDPLVADVRQRIAR